jgi:hypothetical protein
MLVIVGSHHDRVARDLVAAWAPNAKLLTCEDLSTRGWRYHLRDRAASRAVVAGHVLPESAIDGVVVRRMAILPDELVPFAVADRAYAAAEMHAFLFSWLTSLACPVLNRPAGNSLCGPDWRPLQWMHMARLAGLDTDVVHCRVPAARRGEVEERAVTKAPWEVNVVGHRCLGALDVRYEAAAKRLAALAGTPLLTVRFHAERSAPCFHSASPLPDLSNAELAQAVRDHFDSCLVEA